MRKLVVALSLSTLFLAISTAYLVHELRLARASVPMSAAVAAQPGQPTSAAHPEAHAAAAITSAESGGDENFPTPVTTTSDGQTHTMTREQARANAVQQAREFLKTLADPERRRAYLEENKNQMRANYPGLAKYLGLDEVAFDRFLEVLASQELTLREKVSHCALDASCRFPGYDDSIGESMRLEAEALVGAETYRKFESFRDSRQERESVALLRGRLGDTDHMSDAQAERLALALTDERKNLEKDQATRVDGLTSFGSGGISIYAGDNPEAIAAADALNRRMRDRAARELTAGQLAVYDQMRDDTMNTWRSFAEMRASQHKARQD
jgi:hypothetical protein